MGHGDGVQIITNGGRVRRNMLRPSCGRVSDLRRMDIWRSKIDEDFFTMDGYMVLNIDEVTSLESQAILDVR